MSDSNKKTSPSSKDPPLAQKVFYTMMIANDMRTNIKFFFQHEISDLRKYTRHIFNFCRSRSEYLTQAQIYMFLETETPGYHLRICGGLQIYAVNKLSVIKMVC